MVHVGSTHPLDSIALFLRHRDSLRARRQGNIVVCILAEQLQELVGIGRNQLGQLGVSGTKLLQDGLEHLRLLLNNLAELLKLGVVPEEIQVTKITALACRGGCRCRCRSAAAATSGRTTAALLGRQIEQVDASVVVTAMSRCRLRRCAASRGGRGATLLLFLLDIVGDTLGRLSDTHQGPRPHMFATTHIQQVLHSAVGVVEGGAHSRLDLASLEAHGLHARDGLGALSTHGQAGRVASAGRGIGGTVRGGRSRDSRLRRRGLGGRGRDSRRPHPEGSCGGRSRGLGGGGWRGRRRRRFLLGLKSSSAAEP